jgi:hypothetical protein
MGPIEVTYDEKSRARLEAFERSLTNHTPTPEQVAEIEKIRFAGKQLGAVILGTAADSRERSLALTHVEDAVMWAVKGVILNG